jgi:hypothetical protein
MVRWDVRTEILLLRGRRCHLSWMSIWHAWYMEFSGDKAMSSSTGHGNSEFACMTPFGLFSGSQIPYSGGNGQSSSQSNRFPWSPKVLGQSWFLPRIFSSGSMIL